MQFVKTSSKGPTTFLSGRKGKPLQFLIRLVGWLVLNTTFNNISVILRRSFLLVEETFLEKRKLHVD
jgi:hypothetical protein